MYIEADLHTYGSSDAILALEGLNNILCLRTSFKGTVLCATSSVVLHPRRTNSRMMQKETRDMSSHSSGANASVFHDVFIPRPNEIQISSLPGKCHWRTQCLIVTSLSGLPNCSSAKMSLTTMLNASSGHRCVFQGKWPSFHTLV